MKIETILKVILPILNAIKPALVEALEEQNPNHKQLIIDLVKTIEDLDRVATDIKEGK